MIQIHPLTVEQQGRLHEVTVLGSKDFCSFTLDAGGRPLVVMVMTKAVEAQMAGHSPAPPAPDDQADAPVEPPARPPVKIRTM